MSTRYSPLIVRVVFGAKVSPDRIVHMLVSTCLSECGFCIYRTSRASFVVLKNISALFYGIRASKRANVKRKKLLGRLNDSRAFSNAKSADYSDNKTKK